MSALSRLSSSADQPTLQPITLQKLIAPRKSSSGQTTLEEHEKQMRKEEPGVSDHRSS